MMDPSLVFTLLYVLSSVTQRVQSSPRVWTADVPAQVSGLEGSCLVVPCAFNYPTPQTTITQSRGFWHAPGRTKFIYSQDPSQVAPGFRQRTSIEGDLSTGNCTLVIDPVWPADLGTFCFRIEMPEFNRFSYCQNAVSITVQDEPELPSLSVSDELRVGEQFTASCSVFHSCPSDPPHLTWSHSASTTVQSQQLTNGQWEMISSLTFTATKSDHNKPLSCTAAYRGGKKVESSRTLIVNYAPVDVRVESESSVEEGDSVELRCSSDGNPAVHSYQWHSSSGALQFEGQAYRLEKVSRHTEALYCTAINTEGQGRSSLVQLNVLYPPWFKVGSGCHSNISTVTCVCMVDSAPPSLVQWSVPNRILPITKVERHSSVIIAILHETLGFADQAFCHASNTKGNATMSFTLNKTDDGWMIYAVVATSVFAMAVTFLLVWRLIKRSRGSEDNHQSTVMQNMGGAKANASQRSTAKRERKLSSYEVSTKPYTNQAIYNNMEEEGGFHSCEDDIYANV